MLDAAKNPDAMKEQAVKKVKEVAVNHFAGKEQVLQQAPSGKHTAWGYCHVPHSATVDMTEAIEKQVERFAPGFRDRILARHTMNTEQLQAYNANYIGGDINGGAATIDQLFTRPVLRASPYRTAAKGLYICSSSTPPGGGVHGMSGYHAARRALRDVFRIDAAL